MACCAVTIMSTTLPHRYVGIPAISALKHFYASIEISNTSTHPEKQFNVNVSEEDKDMFTDFHQSAELWPKILNIIHFSTIILFLLQLLRKRLYLLPFHIIINYIHYYQGKPLHATRAKTSLIEPVASSSSPIDPSSPADST